MEMEPKPSSQSPTPQNPKPQPRDFLLHLETYLSKRDGVDKLLKITRYATKIIISSSLLPPTHPLSHRLHSFESNIGLSRKAFRLGKFIQDVNSLRSTNQHSLFSLFAYGGEGLYYFIEQFVWLTKSGLIDKKYLYHFQKISSWCEFIGYFGSIGLKVGELRRFEEDEKCLVSSIEVAEVRGIGCGEVQERLRRLGEKKLLKRLSVLQDLADGLMALADLRDGKGRFSGPLLVSWAGLFSSVISTHKNWVSC